MSIGPGLLAREPSRGSGPKLPTPLGVVFGEGNVQADQEFQESAWVCIRDEGNRWEALEGSPGVILSGRCPRGPRSPELLV